MAPGTSWKKVPPLRPRKAVTQKREIEMTKHFTGRAKQAVLGALVITGILLGQTQSAAAATSGITGSSSTPASVCQSGAGMNRTIYASIPTMFASNRTAGAGNDAQIVRYWVRAYDITTGGVLTNWVAGGAAWANDNASAVFPSAGTAWGVSYNAKFTTTNPNSVRLQYYLAWYTSADVQLGTTDFVITQYKYIGIYMGAPYLGGTAGSC